MTTQLEDRKIDPAVALPAIDETAPREPHRQFALKHEDCFVVADSYGDIRGTGDGLFRDDTRVLSRFRLFIGGRMPSLLGASLSQDNILFTANLTNLATIGPNGSEALPGVVHIDRTRFIWQDRMFERITFTNYSAREVVLPVRLDFDADFRDMFEVRGTTRSRRGRAHDALVDAASVTFRYEGLDNVARQSVIAFSIRPDQVHPNHADFLIVVARRDSRALYLEVGHSEEIPSSDRFRAAAARARFAMRSKRRQGATVFSSGRVFNDWLTRTRADIALLTTDLETGPYPYAGIPWFSTAFGRDGVISALQMLWLNPELARGVLAFLARYQSTETSVFDDAEPGKIMHETRKGEMAVLRELPFGRYYGGVDTTPLYVYLASSYAERTGDEAFVDHMWDSLGAATAWMEEVGARNGEGFVTYNRAADTVCSTRAGRTVPMPSSMPTAPSPKGRSHWSRCKVMPSPHIMGWRRWPPGAATTPRRRTGAPWQRGSVRPWRRISGCRTAISMLWRSTEKASNARFARPTPVTCFMSGCRRRNGLRLSPPNCSLLIFIAVGAFARWPTTRSHSTRCPITMARSGRTTPRSAPPGSPAITNETAS